MMYRLTHYMRRPISELLSKKKPVNSNAKSPKPIARLSANALEVIPCLLWADPASPLMICTIPLEVELVLLSIS